jgi:hypothetical protein
MARKERRVGRPSKAAPYGARVSSWLSLSDFLCNLTRSA